MKINPQAKKLNDSLKNECSWINKVFSQVWKSIYFPNEWIVSQSAEAKKSKYNATIWIALDENGDVLILPSVLDNFSKKINKNVLNYAPTWWIMELRELRKKEITRKNPSLKSTISNPIVCNWITSAISIVSELFVWKNDTIIVPDMFWWNYKLLLESLNFGNIKTYNTFKNKSLDLTNFENVCKEEKKEKLIIIFNFPNNPSWYSPTKSEVLEIKNIIKRLAYSWKKLIIIIDDAYFGLFYEKNTYTESLFWEISNIDKNVLTIKVDWVSKEDYAWWVRIWFVTFWWNFNSYFYELLEQKVLWIIRATFSNISNISQQIIINIYNNSKLLEEKEINHNLLESRYREIRNILNTWKYDKYFESIPFNSWYFMSIKLKNDNAEEVRKTLLKKYSTWVIMIKKDILRIAFSSIKKEDIKTVLKNIKSAIIDNEK